MFCTNCGHQINENSKFCTNCGTVIAISQESVVAPNTAPISQQPLESDIVGQTLSFYKQRSFLGAVYKRIFSDVIITNQQLTLQQTTKNFLGKENTISQTIPRATIQSAQTHTSISISYIVVSMITIALAIFIDPIVLLATIFWLWFGYSKEIQISTTDGNKIIVPLEGLAGQGNDAQRLLDLCNNN